MLKIFDAMCLVSRQPVGATPSRLVASSRWKWRCLRWMCSRRAMSIWVYGNLKKKNKKREVNRSVILNASRLSGRRVGSGGSEWQGLRLAFVGVGFWILGNGSWCWCWSWCGDGIGWGTGGEAGGENKCVVFGREHEERTGRGRRAAAGSGLGGRRERVGRRETRVDERAAAIAHYHWLQAIGRVCVHVTRLARHQNHHLSTCAGVIMK